MAHRSIICALLSDGVCRIDNIALSEDILATIDCAGALGAKVEVLPESLIITGISGRCAHTEADFPCRESGSTMRFFRGIAMALGIRARFYGSETLLGRPFGIYEEICRKQQIRFERKADHILVDGRLQPACFEIPGNISSQFVSGFLFGLPLLTADSCIRLKPPVESRSYIDLTLQALSAFDVKADPDGNDLMIPGKQTYRHMDLTVEGDYSNAAFLDAFNLLGGKVSISGLDDDSRQGDRVYRKHFESLQKGCTTIDLSDCPDLGPILFTMAALLHGGDFIGTKRLQMKESDRGRVMCEELAKCGVKTVMEENRIRILPSEVKKPDEPLLSHNDHRIAMSLAVLLTKTGGTIREAQAVSKSYPDFFTDLGRLGIGLKMETNSEVLKGLHDGMDQ